MNYELEFENSLGQRRKIAEVEAEAFELDWIHSEAAKEALREIHKFCHDRNYHIPYTRSWFDNERRIITFDVGSHTEFFYLKEVSD